MDEVGGGGGDDSTSSSTQGRRLLSYQREKPLLWHVHIRPCWSGKETDEAICILGPATQESHQLCNHEKGEKVRLSVSVRRGCGAAGLVGCVREMCVLCPGGWSCICSELLINFLPWYLKLNMHLTHLKFPASLHLLMLCSLLSQHRIFINLHLG